MVRVANNIISDINGLDPQQLDTPQRIKRLLFDLYANFIARGFASGMITYSIIRTSIGRTRYPLTLNEIQRVLENDVDPDLTHVAPLVVRPPRLRPPPEPIPPLSPPRSLQQIMEATSSLLSASQPVPRPVQNVIPVVSSGSIGLALRSRTPSPLILAAPAPAPAPAPRPADVPVEIVDLNTVNREIRRLKNGNNNEASGLANRIERDINRRDDYLRTHPAEQYVINNVSAYASDYRQILRAANINFTESDITNMVHDTVRRLGYNIDPRLMNTS